MSKRKNRQSVIFILLLVVLILILVSVLLSFQRPLEREEFDVSFIVKDYGIGFDVNKTALTFGVLNPGGVAIRNVTIANSRRYPVEIKVMINEDIVDLFVLEKSYFIGSGESYTIPVVLSIPQDFPLGNYTGKIRFDIYKA